MQSSVICPSGLKAKCWPCKLHISGSNPSMGRFFIFLNFVIFKLLITFLGELGRSTIFNILMYMPIGNYHINKKFQLSPALF